MKKIVFTVVLATLLLFTITGSALAGPTVMLDGRHLKLSTTPVIEQGCTLVPLRVIFEAMGAAVSWDQKTQTATAIKGDRTVSITIGSLETMVNGEKYKLEVPAKVIDGHTMAPLRFVAEIFRGTVGWDGATQTINIVSNVSDSVSDLKITLSFTFGTREGTYTGTIIKGLPNGYGKFITQNISGETLIYTGEFCDGHFHGYGQTAWANGLRVEGKYINDDIPYGSIYDNEVLFYKGQLKDGIPNGEGTSYKPDRSIEYEGIWVDGRYSGTSSLV